jgi:hypothetical protein
MSREYLNGKSECREKWHEQGVLMGSVRDSANTAVWDYSVFMELPIHRPASTVWAYFVGDRKNIWTKSDYKTVAGETGQVGEVYTHAHTVYGAQLFYEAIKVKPDRQLVLKITYRRHEKDDRKLMGYDFIALNEVAGQTTLTFQQALAMPLEMLEDDLRFATEKQDRRLAEIFQNLKATVESSP